MTAIRSVVIPSPGDLERKLPFYLAAEEWVAANLPAGDWFFAWQVRPTVICGRHQDMAREVDMEYAATHGIEVWRRRSGGGCVYADCNNVMFSYITTETGNVQESFGRYTGAICRMLKTVGINATPTGRNDVAIAGRKVAGNAWYKASGRSIVHGTMLVDADFSTMGKVLTPSRAKLESKGVKSVPARVTTLREHGLTMSCDNFIAHATQTLCGAGDYSLTENDIAEVERLMQIYLDPEFLHRNPGVKLPYSISTNITGAGNVVAEWSIGHSGLIDRIRISGDILADKDAIIQTEQALCGIRPELLDKARLAELISEHI